MRKVLFLLSCLLAGVAGAVAQGFPTISTDDDTKWYLIQFMNGGNALTAETAGADITTATATGSDAQQWKITGDATNGYTFTNKKGHILYVSSAAKNQMVKSATTATGVSKFFINATTNGTYGSGYEIQPVGNTAISMNLWGGPSENRGVGLWDKADQNNPVQFVEYSVFENLGKISIIPYPAEISIEEGSLAVSTLNSITYPSSEVKKCVTEFADMLAKTSGTNLTVKQTDSTAYDGYVWLAIDETLPAEGYTLTVGEKGIQIKASAKAGFFYAVQTLKQLLPRDLFGDTLNENADWNIPYVTITDQPKFEHRGFMMDVARHFFDKDEVKKVLDIMALYKLNRLHWHLTDDQGWRIEIPEYPLLTEVGAVRSGSFTSPGDGSKFFDDTEYGRGMWFSQDDLREIVAYAAERNIDILPEIDLPGHMVAAVTAYPEFSCDPTKEYSVRLDGGISEDVLNVGDDKVIEFLKCVLDNVAEIFPYPYIHIGGDECPTTQWATNELCLKRVQEEGLTGVNQLQSWLVEELGTYLKEKHGKDIVVWDELLSHWSSDNAVKPVIMAWNSLGKTAEAANKGFKSIATPHSHVYIDFMQVGPDKTTIDEPYYGGWSETNTNTIEEVYALNPAGSLAGREEYCMGTQVNLWAETLNDNTELEYQLLPRMLALAETGWLPASKKNWSGFYQRLQSHDEILDFLGYTYAKHYIEQTELSEYEQTVKEAGEILAASVRGGVGYPVAELHDALNSAFEAATEDDYAALTTAIEAYKTADITLPDPNKTYQIVSASTYYKRQYAGSTIYVKDDGVRFHYTPQTEPEELWKFEATEGGYIMKSLFCDKKLTMATYNAAVGMSDTGTPVRIDKATIASRNVTYVPGAATISAVNGYNAAITGNVKRLSAEPSGNVYAKDEAALCYNGTWKFVEITDYKTQLLKLLEKCERIYFSAQPDKVGQPTREALDYLMSYIIEPINQIMDFLSFSEESYNGYVDKYYEFMMMPRTTALDVLDPGQYYYIRNAYFTSYYAAMNRSTKRVEPKSKGTSDNYLWCLDKNDDGTVRIYNKLSGTAAYINKDADDQTLMVGNDYDWSLVEVTTDTGNKGIAIVGGNGTSGWYTNPDAWNYVLTKPYTWGASVWTLEKSGIEVPTAIEEVKDESRNADAIFDLQGRKIKKPTKGIYIIDGNKVFIK